MKKLFYSNTSGFVIVFIFSCIFLFTKCINSSSKIPSPATDNKFSQFAGSKKCASCHKAIYESHIRTGHFLTSQPASDSTVMGSFEKGKNTYAYNPALFIAMEKRDSGLYQVVYFKGAEKKVLPFNIVFGSGGKGQSFAYWLQDRLFQLPITYFTIADQWSNSPGFPDKVQFDRPITSRCLECHVTYAEKISEPDNTEEKFDPASIIFGVDCEKCHGPAAEHVAYQTKNPAEKLGKYIINPKIFTRQQKLDLCAMCHGGNIKKTQPSFSYRPGDTLSHFFKLDTLSQAKVNFGTVDAHGNQYGLLQSSKCFRKSDTMTCNTCHNPHDKERGNKALFSQRCMSCHNSDHGNFCTLKGTSADKLKQNCIDCHMPAKLSQSIVIFSAGSEVPKAALFRSHFISVYQDETKKMLDFINQKK
jgi:hypothetical protein